MTEGRPADQPSESAERATLPASCHLQLQTLGTASGQLSMFGHNGRGSSCAQSHSEVKGDTEHKSATGLIDRRHKKQKTKQQLVSSPFMLFVYLFIGCKSTPEIRENMTGNRHFFFFFFFFFFELNFQFSSLIKSKPPWLHPEELKLKNKETEKQYTFWFIKLRLNKLISCFLDFYVPPTEQGHLRTNHVHTEQPNRVTSGRITFTQNNRTGSPQDESRSHRTTEQGHLRTNHVQSE